MFLSTVKRRPTPQGLCLSYLLQLVLKFFHDLDLRRAHSNRERVVFIEANWYFWDFWLLPPLKNRFYMIKYMCTVLFLSRGTPLSPTTNRLTRSSFVTRCHILTLNGHNYFMILAAMCVSVISEWIWQGKCFFHSAYQRNQRNIREITGFADPMCLLFFNGMAGLCTNGVRSRKIRS